MLEFKTAVAEAYEEGQAFEFSVNDVLCKAYKPEDGQIAILVASTGRHSSNQESVAGVINFFFSTLDDETANYLSGVLLDRRDTFGLSHVQQIVEGMIEEWSGRPTNSSPASATSRTTDGQNSTPLTPALT